MTFPEVETELETAVMAIGFEPSKKSLPIQVWDKDSQSYRVTGYEPDEPVTPAIALGRVARMFPDETEVLWSRIEAKTITLPEYRETWLRLIEKARSRLFSLRVQRKLTELCG